MPRKRTSEPELTLSSGAAPARRKVAARPRVQRSTAETAAAPVALAATTVEPSFEAIARLAYSYWDARGRKGGSPEEDWAHAQQELRGRL